MNGATHVDECRRRDNGARIRYSHEQVLFDNAYHTEKRRTPYSTIQPSSQFVLEERGHLSILIRDEAHLASLLPVLSDARQRLHSLVEMEKPVNVNIMKMMKAATADLPSSPASTNVIQLEADNSPESNKMSAAERSSFIPEAPLLESPNDHYRARGTPRTPSFTRAGSFLLKYPSLSKLRQLPSFSSINSSQTFSCSDVIKEQDDDDDDEEEDNVHQASGGKGTEAIAKELEVVTIDDSVDTEKMVDLTRDIDRSAVETSGLAENEENIELSESWDDFHIEVMPGVFKRLRGSDETNKAFESGECVEVLCLFCTARLACIADCEGVICPLCMSMTPIDSPDKEKARDTVGLGIELE